MTPVDVDAMTLTFTPDELERYSRQILLPQIGAEGQARLRAASVLVIGAGGLGAPLLQLLAGSGIGRLGVIDGDVVSLSNLHRQTLFSTQDVGLPKVAAAAHRLREINPLVDVQIWQEEATPAWLEEQLGASSGAVSGEGQGRRWSLVCDGTDNATTRLAVSDACVRARLPLVSGAAQGFSGQLAVYPNQPGAPCYRCLYPEVAAAPTTGCALAGVVGPVTTVMAGFMALEVLREVLGRSAQQPQLQIWDALDGTLRRFPIAPNPACTAPHETVEKTEARP